MGNDSEEYLEPTYYLDSDSAEVREFAEEATRGAASPVKRAVRLFEAVRDGIRYDPYSASLEPEGFRASRVLERKRGFCVPKAILLAAAARAVGIPSRLRFADVRNHLATPKLLEKMGTDVFAFHGFTELYLEGRWVKATPTFNRSLCEKFGIEPLEFDGKSDSVLHPFDREGRKHMEYLVDHGVFADLPRELLMESWRETYGDRFLVEAGAEAPEDFEEAAGRVAGEGG